MFVTAIDMAGRNVWGNYVLLVTSLSFCFVSVCINTSTVVYLQQLPTEVLTALFCCYMAQ